MAYLVADGQFGPQPRGASVAEPLFGSEIAGWAFMKIYMDESGNSGADLYDPSQPFYALAAVLGTDSAFDNLDAFVDDLRHREHLQMPELKGGRLLKSSPGRRSVRGILDKCIELGVHVCISAIHKPFMAAAVAVEDYTDHAYNPSFDSSWLLDADKKEPIAESLFSQIPEGILLQWWSSRHGDSVSRFQDAHDELLAAMRAANGLDKLANRFSTADLAKIWEPRTGRTNIDSGGYSPNSTAFGTMLLQLEATARSLEIRNVLLIHDEQSEFQARYETEFERLRQFAPTEVVFSNGNSLRVPVEHITSLSFADSAESLPLQIADCMAALTRVIIGDISVSNVVGSKLQRQFRSSLNALYSMRSPNESPFVVGPISWQPRAFSALAGMD